MFIGNRKTRIVHYEKCSYTTRMNKSKAILFSTLKEAEDEGYRLCKCCSPIGSVKLRTREFRSFCKERSIRYEIEKDRLMIQTPSSEWMVMIGKRSRLRLYHRNTLGNKCGYHIQARNKKNIMQVLRYIVKHDDYRRTNPLPKEKRNKNTKTTVRISPKSSLADDYWEIALRGNEASSRKTKKRKESSGKKGMRKRKLEALQMGEMMYSIANYA